LGVEVVTHEITHGVLAYFKWGSKEEPEEPYEPICYAIGDMAKEFYRKAYKAKITKTASG
jgi:hypothetical protein